MRDIYKIVCPVCGKEYMMPYVKGALNEVICSCGYEATIKFEYLSEHFPLKKIGEYGADGGTIRINNIWISNGVGDGNFNVYFAATKPENFEEINGLGIDLQLCKSIKIGVHDTVNGIYNEFNSKDLDNARYVTIAKDKNGNFCLIKKF